jgi:molecular chaperone GrpE (heat shock protein)
MPKDTKQDDHNVEDTLQEEVLPPEDAHVEKLKKQLTEQEEITRRAQSDYLRTKMEFDGYVKRTDEAKA